MRVAKGDRKVKNEAGKPADAAGWLQEAMQRCRTLAKLFGVEKPFLNAPIPGLADAELAAAVSQAGGLGVIAAQRLTPEALRKEIAELRRRTQQPFAVAVEVPPREPAPADASRGRSFRVACRARVAGGHDKLQAGFTFGGAEPQLASRSHH